MKKHYLIILFTIIFQAQALAENPIKAKNDNKYITVVKTFADTLLSVATDEYGSRSTAMWASVIDLNTLNAPIRGIAPTKGVRPHDRALGGSNYYHDVTTMKVFDILSDITGESKYRNAVKAYSKDFLNYCQNPKTGLLGWGEHLFYSFYRDTVSISESKLFGQSYYFGYPHEFLAWTPPWERLWAIDGEKTQRAIEGVMWHFQGPDTKTYLFNRHADWNDTKYQNVVMPWIKHSVLFAYSFAILYKKTGEEIWKQRAKDCAYLYWNNRHHDTNLIFNNFYHATETDAGKQPDIGSAGLYAYWMYKTGEVLNDDKLKSSAQQVLQSYAKYGWNESGQYFYQGLNLDGSLPEDPKKANAWKIGYGSSSLFSFARANTYLASKIGSETFLKLSIDCEKQVPDSQLPEEYTIFNISEAINYYVDLYELTNKKYYLAEAEKYADLGIEKFAKNGLFSRQTNDNYYEAKLGVGDFVAGLLRIGMIQSGRHKELKKYDLSF